MKKDRTDAEKLADKVSIVRGATACINLLACMETKSATMILNKKDNNEISLLQVACEYARNIFIYDVKITHEVLDQIFATIADTKYCKALTLTDYNNLMIVTRGLQGVRNEI